MNSNENWGTPPWTVDFTAALAALAGETGIAIVGGGLTGVSAAYHVRRARPDLPVIVLEAETVGGGASGRNGGNALEDTSAGPMRGFENCLGSLAELVAAEKIECGLELHGCWEISHQRAAIDSPINWTDDGVSLRAYSVVPGGVLDPGKLVAGLARAAVNAGATLHEHCRVEAIDFAPRLCLHTTLGDVRAQRVVLATNAYSFELSELGKEGVPVLAVALATAPLSDEAIVALGLGSRLPFYTEDLPYLWGRVTTDNVLVLGSGLLPFEAEATIRGTAARLLFHGLERRVRGFHKTLADVEFTHHWAGPICITHDHRPVLRAHSCSPNVLVAGGYSGHGLAQSVRMGKLVAKRLGTAR